MSGLLQFIFSENHLLQASEKVSNHVINQKLEGYFFMKASWKRRKFATRKPVFTNMTGLLEAKLKEAWAFGVCVRARFFVFVYCVLCCVNLKF